MLLTSLMRMCFCMVIKTDEGSSTLYSFIAHHLKSELLAKSLFKDLLCNSLEFVFPQVKIIYFVSEHHKPGWLVCHFCSIYRVGRQYFRSFSRNLHHVYFARPSHLTWKLVSRPSFIYHLYISNPTQLIHSKPGFTTDGVAVFQLTSRDSDLPIDT